MLFVLTGSSGSGKTTVARAVRADNLEVHDSDEDGVPSNADTIWRQSSLESWVQRAAALTGGDLLLTGQSPIGEVLAAPSAPILDGIAVALLEVEDRDRLIRLENRDPGKWSRQAKHDFVGWARWHRRHASDPAHAPEVLTTHSWTPMRWDRWTGWTAGDPRWQTEVIDTTDRTIDDCAADVQAWIARVRADSTWPLRPGWLQP